MLSPHAMESASMPEITFTPEKTSDLSAERGPFDGWGTLDDADTAYELQLPRGVLAVELQYISQSGAYARTGTPDEPLSPAARVLNADELLPIGLTDPASQNAGPSLFLESPAAGTVFRLGFDRIR